jgi:hypothetical protein
VGILHDDMTGSGKAGHLINVDLPQVCEQLTRIISGDGRFHDRFHPVTDDGLLVRAEIICLVVIVLNTKTITTRIHILVVHNLVANDIDEAFHFCLLHYYRQQTALQPIHIISLEHEISQLPRMPLSLLPHPPIMVRLADLFKNATSLCQGHAEAIDIAIATRPLGAGHRRRRSGAFAEDSWVVYLLFLDGCDRRQLSFHFILCLLGTDSILRRPVWHRPL